jgi:response regulator RpfG family c-di-GMP phosphodiesterase
MMNAGDITVLLVDDEEMIRECMTAYLEDEGFRVLGAQSGEEALKLIAVLTPAVCISDMRLPGMNGDEFITKAFGLCPDTIYMLHTGMFYTLSDGLRAIGMTDEDVLLKPIHDISKLARKIRLSVAAGRMNK